MKTLSYNGKLLSPSDLGEMAQQQAAGKPPAPGLYVATGGNSFSVTEIGLITRIYTPKRISKGVIAAQFTTQCVEPFGVNCKVINYLLQEVKVTNGDNHIRKLLSSFVWSDSIVFWYNGKLISNERLPCLLTTGRTRESIIRELEQEENQLTEDFKRYEIEKLHNLEEVVKSKEGPRV